MVTKTILIILTAQDPKHIEPHNALPAYPRQDPLVEKKTYYTELANQVVSKVRLLTRYHIRLAYGFLGDHRSLKEYISIRTGLEV